MAVTKTNNLKRGMKDANGSTDIADLQTALNATGKYNLDVDGSFGPATEAAVIDYQKNTPGLVVDGVVGTNTWGKLTATPPATAIKPTTATKPAAATKPTTTTKPAQTTKPATTTKPSTAAKPETKPTQENIFTTPAGNTYEEFVPPHEVKYDPYEMSEAVKQAFATVEQLLGNTPAPWADPYADQRKGYLDAYENRDPFSYNANEDALYQQYKDQYIQQGKLAMMDAMGQAAALNGGYGSSYAQAVGQQVYNQQLSQLNAIIPELYDRAYGIYQQEGNNLLNMYDIYTGLSGESYDKYLGDVDRHYAELDAATRYAQDLYEQEYGAWADKTSLDIDILNAKNNIAQENWATKLGISRDETSAIWEQNLQTEKTAKSDLINLITATGYKPTDAELKAAGMTREQADGYAKAYTDSKTTVTAPVKYTELSTSDQDWWEKKLRNCNTPEAVVEIGKQMDARGYNPNLVDSIVNSYMAQFEDEEDDGFWDKVSNWWQGVTK